MQLALGVEHDRVLQRSTVQRVRVRHEGNTARDICRPQGGLQLTGRSLDPELANRSQGPLAIGGCRSRTAQASRWQPGPP